MATLTRTRLVLLSIGLLFLLAAFLSLGFGLFLMSPADKGGADQVFIVKEGSSLKEVAGDLEKAGLISNKTLFVLWTRVKGYGKDIRAGEYALSPAMAPVQLLEILRKGLVILHPVTIPEGFTTDQIADALAAKGLADKKRFLELTRTRRCCDNTESQVPVLRDIFFPTPIISAGNADVGRPRHHGEAFQASGRPTHGQITGDGDEVRGGGDPGLYCRKGKQAGLRSGRSSPRCS